MYKPRILVVDDEPGFLRVLKIVLERTGRYMVREEDDSTRALGSAREFRPDLILLDLVMPKVSGGTLALNLRSEPNLRDTPIVFLSASIVRAKCCAAQIAGFPAVAKPIGIEELVATIDAHLPTHADGTFMRGGSFLSTLAHRFFAK